MWRFLKLAWLDLRRGASIDLYISLLVCAVVAVMSILGFAKLEWVLSAILVVLLVQIGNFISERRKLDELLLKLESSKTAKLVSMLDTDFEVFIKRASKISMVCVANFRFLATNSVHFSEFVGRGGSLRQVMLDAADEASMALSIARSVGASTDPKSKIAQIELTIAKLREIASHNKNKGTVELKCSRFPTPIILSWFEFPSEPPIMFVTITGFKQPTSTRLTLVVRQDQNKMEYEFFSTFFENLWKWQGSTSVNL